MIIIYIVKICEVSSDVLFMALFTAYLQLANLYPRSRPANASDGMQRVSSHCNINVRQGLLPCFVSASFIVRHVTVGAATMTKTQQ